MANHLTFDALGLQAVRPLLTLKDGEPPLDFAGDMGLPEPPADPVLGSRLEIGFKL